MVSTVIDHPHTSGHTLSCLSSLFCSSAQCDTAVRRRYELHHGVRISDSALVDAAVLSDRYIADRFLPDKAIDLVRP